MNRRRRGQPPGDAEAVGSSEPQQGQAQPSGERLEGERLQGERLQKVLARAGVASRRAAERLIEQGAVTVNGRPAELGQRVQPSDEVRVHGRPLPATGRPRTLLFHKPRGVLTTVSDDRGRRTVMDYLPAIPGLHPVGRLDRDSEGLLLLTTDGDLTLKLTHPRYGHEKEYRVWCAEGEVAASDLERLEQGLELDDGPARALRAEAAPGGCLVVLTEGRNRQVRRMLAALGYRVTRLQRTRFAGLELGELPPGGWRELGATELAALDGKLGRAG